MRKSGARHFGEHHKHSGKHTLLLALLGVAALVVVGIGLYFLGTSLENKGAETTYGNLEERFADERTVTWKGQEYSYNQLQHAYLFMGVDKDPDSGDTTVLPGRNGGQSDFLMLLLIDQNSKTVRRLQIDRDTMAEITVLGVLGNPLGTNTQQICLSHGFGDGKAQSCEFTVDAVSRLLQGITINGYVSLDMSGITALNDLLGGVTVTVTDDFSEVDATLVQGETITLRGTQAETFVRSRKKIGDGSAAARMERQQTYLTAAIDMINTKVSDNSNYVGTLFDGLKDYLITDLSRGRMINEAAKAKGYTIESMQTLAGEHTIGPDGFMEFHPDEDALTDLVVSLFYVPKTAR